MEKSFGLRLCLPNKKNHKYYPKIFLFYINNKKVNLFTLFRLFRSVIVIIFVTDNNCGGFCDSKLFIKMNAIVLFFMHLVL